MLEGNQDDDKIPGMEEEKGDNSTSIYGST